MATDVAKAKSFYGKLLGWQLEDMQMGDMTYTMIKVGDGTGGGILKNPVPGMPSMWVPYVDVDDLEAATEKARTLGAKVMREATDVGQGRFTIISDPNGTMLGLWERKNG
jgi:predicted enzyme related to lactoylglutathione lyase